MMMLPALDDVSDFGREDLIKAWRDLHGVLSD